MLNGKRKPRSDRKHALYKITNVLTGEFYIGVTVTNGPAIKRAVKIRFQKHVSRALVEEKDWSLCKAIRSWGPECFVPEVVEVVRGKVAAHARERELIGTLDPVLNSW